MCSRTTLGFDFLHLFMVCAQTYALLVWGWLIDKNIIFLCLYLIFSWFCVYTHAHLWILKFQDSLNQKVEICAQTINDWRNSKRSVVLLRRQWLRWFSLGSYKKNIRILCSRNIPIIPINKKWWKMFFNCKQITYQIV